MFSDLMTVLPVHDLGIRPTVEVETVRHWSCEHLLANLERQCRTCEAEHRDWQVLSPVRRSALGTERLNLITTCGQRAWDAGGGRISYW